MPASSTPPEQSPVLLRSACEQCLACLKDLLGIHLDIDPPTSVIAPNAPDCVYRLRKVLLHVDAISAWQLDTHVMHVIAPELRAASEQLDGFWDEARRAMDLEDGEEPVGRKTRQARAHAKTRKELVSAHVHPTPQRLFLPKRTTAVLRQRMTCATTPTWSLRSQISRSDIASRSDICHNTYVRARNKR